MKLLGAFLAVFLVSSPCFAEITSKAKDIVIEQQKDLPELAQASGEAMELRSIGNGTTYLYIEQQSFKRIAIFDVTDPAQIKEVGVVNFEGPGAFDFVRPLGESAELLYFRANKAAAILDFRKPKQPTLIMSSDLQHAARFDSIGQSGLLLSDGVDVPVAVPHDYQLVDIATPEAPVVLVKVASVQKLLNNPETGTTYLLNGDGLTVIRQPKIEEEYRASQRASN